MIDYHEEIRKFLQDAQRPGFPTGEDVLLWTGAGIQLTVFPPLSEQIRAAYEAAGDIESQARAAWAELGIPANFDDFWYWLNFRLKARIVAKSLDQLDQETMLIDLMAVASGNHAK